MLKLLAMQLPDYDHAQALALLKEKPNSRLASFDIASKAHRRWDLKQPQEAAPLFCLAFERSLQEGPGDKPSQAPNYFVRAAITFNQVGETAVAEPMLHQATQIDWAAMGLPHDSHMCEWAYEQLLLNQQGSPQAFAQLFTEACTRCTQLGWDFPKIHPKQEALLTIAMGLGLSNIVQILIVRISQRRPVSREARQQLAAAQQWLADQSH